MPKISVIIPVYNNRQYLPEAIESVLSQTEKDLEIILVDDGSTDGSVEIMQDYAGQFPEIVRVIRQKNSGPGAARNAGIRSARAGYVAFLDADDAWVPGKLAAQAAVMDADRDVGIVYSDFYFISKASVVVVPGHQRRYHLPRGRVTLDFFYHYFIYTSTAMVRKSCLDRCGFFREDILVGEDYDYFLRLSVLCDAVGIEEKLLAKRKRRESLSNIDALLNEKNDLIILAGFIKRNRAFYRQNKRVVRQELARRNFTLGYQLLRHGNQLLAFTYLLAAFRCRPSFKSFKCLLQTALPAGPLLALKKKVGRGLPPEQETESPESPVL